jgi:hypothetical protein
MRPLHLNGKPIEEATERLLFGRSFERQGQDQRVNLLRAIGAVAEADGKRLDELRQRRRKHFHLWSGGSSEIKSDAFHCFWLVVQLAESVLQISFEDGRLIINPVFKHTWTSTARMPRNVGECLNLRHPSRQASRRPCILRSAEHPADVCLDLRASCCVPILLGDQA